MKWQDAQGVGSNARGTAPMLHQVHAKGAGGAGPEKTDLALLTEVSRF